MTTSEMTLEYWRKVFAVNLEGPLRMSQCVAPIMRDGGGGSIVNIASGPDGRTFASLHDEREWHEGRLFPRREATELTYKLTGAWEKREGERLMSPGLMSDGAHYYVTSVGDASVDVVFSGADHGLDRGTEDDYRRALGVADASSEEILVAYEMNGQPLPAPHGAPRHGPSPRRPDRARPRAFRHWMAG